MPRAHARGRARLVNGPWSGRPVARETIMRRYRHTDSGTKIASVAASLRAGRPGAQPRSESCW